jgi:hypothetical protein
VNLNDFDDYSVLFGDILRGAADAQRALSFPRGWLSVEKEGLDWSSK